MRSENDRIEIETEKLIEAAKELARGTGAPVFLNYKDENIEIEVAKTIDTIIEVGEDFEITDYSQISEIVGEYGDKLNGNL